MRTALALLAAALLVGAEAARWDYAPLVCYEDEGAPVALRVEAAGLTPVDGTGRALAVELTAADGAVHCTVPPQGLDALRLRRADGTVAAGLRFVRPGAASGLAVGDDGLPVLGGERAMLVLPRREARADRRWALLRRDERGVPKPCRLRLAPPAVAEGLPALPAQARDAQALACAGVGVLIECAAGERFASWKHREFRQCLAWIVADLQARGATHVALVPPYAAAPADAPLAPLRTQVADVADAYRCRLVDVDTLTAPALWESQPGVLAPVLNAQGEAARTALLAPWLGG